MARFCIIPSMSFTAPPPELNLEAIQHSFGRFHTEQGQRCVLAGGVQIELVSALNTQDIEVSGAVREPQSQKKSRLRTYETQVYYQPGNDWLLSGDCTCPAGSDCQHCAALAFAWMQMQPDPVADPTQIAEWLAALKLAEALPEATVAKPSQATEQVIYLLHPLPNSLELEVELGLQEAPASNKPWKKIRVVSPRRLLSSDAPSSLPENEQELLQLLAGFERGSLTAAAQRIPLRGKTGAFVLPELVASGRCFWQIPPKKGQTDALRWASPRQIQAEWKSLPGGQQWTASLIPTAPNLHPSGQPPLFCLGSEVIYFDTQQKTLGTVAIEASKLALWLKAPLIPEPALERVSRSLLQILPAPPLPKGIALQEELIHDPSPIPVLFLSRSTFSPHIKSADANLNQPDSPSDIPDAGKQIHQASLYFNYGSQRLPYRPDPPAEESLLLESEHRVYRIQRAITAEKKAYQALLKTGLLPLGEPANALAFAQSGQTVDDLYQARNWHHWLNDSLPELQELGWQVEIGSDFKLDFISSPAWQAELKATDLNGDCFALELGIEINGEAVNLLPLLLRILRTVPDLHAMREQLAQHSTWLLPLDPEPMAVWAARSQHQELPQRWLEVPARRLARILDILIELYDYLPKNETPEALDLSYYAALQMQSQARLNPDDYGVVWQAPEGLREAAELLSGQPQDGKERVVPAGLQAQLRGYQQKGFQWLSHLRELGLNGILADDMGLGKTIQTLCLLLAEREAGRLQTPALVVVPTSVLSTWQAEAQRFAPDLRVLRLHGAQRPRTLKDLKAFDLVITSYALFRQDAPLHQQICYSWLILDEAQMIKNPRSRTALVACAQPASHRLCLSGTPIENHLEELWSLFHFLMPGFLDTLERFNSRFRHPIEKTHDRQRLNALRERIRPFVLRRLKTQVAQELPPKTEILRTVELGSAQRDLYETVRLAVDDQVRKAVADNGFQRSRILVLDALLKLRQICAHPQLLKLPEAQKVERSAKLELLLELLSELLANGRRVLIFSQFVTMLERIEIELQARQISYSKLTGRTRQRDAEIARFQEGHVPVFLISLKAGGVGLNLTAADTVIHYDPWWNPATEQQATDRSWRIGQTQPVFVYKLIAAGTLEEQMVALQESKRALSQDLLGSGSSQKWDSQQLLSLLNPTGT